MYASLGTGVYREDEDAWAQQGLRRILGLLDVPKGVGIMLAGFD